MPRYNDATRRRQEVNAMLLVTTNRNGGDYRLELHGSLAGEWVSVLEQEWRAITAENPNANVTVVVSDIQFIDAAGERLLRRMGDKGATLVAHGAMNRYVIGKVQPSTP
jgi:hypothetical protein